MIPMEKAYKNPITFHHNQEVLGIKTQNTILIKMPANNPMSTPVLVATLVKIPSAKVASIGP
jgi:hypothetical protein